MPRGPCIICLIIILYSFGYLHLFGSSAEIIESYCYGLMSLYFPCMINRKWACKFPPLAIVSSFPLALL
ncbi:hypothetical protein BS78_07G123800 [Paspalum vaginatum]|nr:hypothetical protein BS78_07G123800 [Paspalum vaginatum]